MSNLKLPAIHDFESARAYLDARGKSRVKIGFETTLTHEAHGYVVRHHDSPIVRYTPDGVEIRNAGWLSLTTTDRLHRLTPPSVRVSLAKGGWVESPLYSGRQPRLDWQRVA